MKFVGNIASDSEVVATADGAITAGKPVIVNADGTVAQAAISDASIGSTADSTLDGTNGFYVAGLPSVSKFVGFGRDTSNSSYGTAVVGVVSGSSISYGTKSATSVSSYENYNIEGLTSTTFVLIYRDFNDTNKGKARLGTIDASDNSITYGSIVEFEAGQTSLNESKALTRLTDTTFVIAFEDASDSSKAKAIVGTVSGTNISFGSPVTYATANSSKYNTVAALSSTKIVIAYSDTPSSPPEDGEVIIGTVSGTSISFGSATQYDASRVIRHTVAALSDTKFIIAYCDDRIGNNYATAIAGTVSGTNITLGSPVIFRSSDEANDLPDVTKFTENDFVVGYINDAGNPAAIKGSTSGTTISFGSSTELDSNNSFRPRATTVNDEKIVVSFYPSNNMSARVYNPSSANLTSENFIGFAKDNVADGAVATIQTANSIARDNIQQASASDSLSSASTYGTIGSTPVMAVDTANNRIVIAGRDADGADTGAGKAIVGTIDTSNDTVSFGSFAQFEDGNNTENFAIAFDSSNSKVVIVYSDGADSNNGKAVVGTVSGTSISYGTIVQFDTNARLASVAFDSNAGKIVIAYADYGNSGYGTAIVGTVSGTDISFGTAQVFKSASSTNIDIAFDSSNNKVVVAYVATHHYGIVGTVSGTSISFGSEAKFADNGGSYNKLAFDSSNNKFLIIYKDQATDDGFGIVGTVSGTSISYGSAVEFHDANTSEMDLAFDTESNKFLMAYKDDGDSDKGKYVTASISGTTPSFGSEAVLDSGRALQSNVEYDSGNKRTVINYRDTSGVGTIKLFRHSGFDEDLTTGQQYFVQTDGTLSTSADDPSVIAGTAISGTDLIVKG